MPTGPKSFFWYELMTTDMDAAEAFYRHVVGWEGEPWGGGPGSQYTVMNIGGKPVSGVMPLPEEAGTGGGRPAWLGHIHAGDVDAATEGVRQAGGAVHRAPADIPGIGRFSVVADPQGAIFMLFKPTGGDNPPAPAMTPGHIGWHELYATDWSKAFDFYAGQFGWTKAQAVDMGAMGTYQTFAAGGEAIGGMMDKPAHIPSPVWLFYFNVPAIDAAAADVEAGGCHVLVGPIQVPGGGWIVQCTDPQGAMFALLAQNR